MATNITELTIDDLRALLREVVEEVIEEKIGMMVDPDDGLELREDVVESLDMYLASDRRGDNADDVFRSLGLE